MANKMRVETVFGESPNPEPTPGRSRRKPVNTEIAETVRGLILVTGAFLVLALFLVLLKYFPGTPDLPAIPDTGEYARLFASDEAKLNNYSWVNQKSGIVRIPIKEAMQLVAERGLPARTLDDAASSEGEVMENGATTTESEESTTEDSTSENSTDDPGETTESENEDTPPTDSTTESGEM